MLLQGMVISLNKLQQEKTEQVKEIVEMRVRLEERIEKESNEIRANTSGKVFGIRWTCFHASTLS